MIGSVVNEQYMIQELLGEGGMGVVYKALDLELDRVVALKFLKAEFGDNQLLIRRFRDELKVLASFNHPNITMLYTSFSWQGRPVMVMELLEGEPLNQMIDRRGLIPADVCVPLVRQALAGVGEAHRRGIVHRDLKPANLMLNQANVVKVMDFGIAKIEAAPGLTRTATTMGTPFYMAPEQIDPERFGLTRADARADIYSMGVTLYELLAGEVPFKGATEFTIHRAHLEQPPQPPTVYYPHIPEPVVKAVLRAMAKEPSQRFQTAEEFAEALGPAALAAPAARPQPYTVLPVPQQAGTPAGEAFHPAASLAALETKASTAAPAFSSGPANNPVDRSDTLFQRWFGRTGSPKLVGTVIAVLLLVGGGGFGIYVLLNSAHDAPTSGQIMHGGGGGSQPSGEAANAGGSGQFHLPQSVPAETSNNSNTDISLPIVETPSKKVSPAPEMKPVPARPPVIESVVAGHWSGDYTSCTDNSVTEASMALTENTDSDTNSLLIAGTLVLHAAGGAQSCKVNGTFMKSRNRLTLKAASCNVGEAPVYLSVAHTSVLSLSGDKLQGIVQPDTPCMIISFKKM